MSVGPYDVRRPAATVTDRPPGCLRDFPGARGRGSPRCWPGQPFLALRAVQQDSASDQWPFSGLRVVWDAPGLDDAERRVFEALLSRILANALADFFGRPGRQCPGGAAGAG